jgi:serine protease
MPRRLLTALSLIALLVTAAPLPVAAAGTAPRLPAAIAALRDGTVTHLLAAPRRSATATPASSPFEGAVSAAAVSATATLAASIAGVSLTPAGVSNGMVRLQLTAPLSAARATELAAQLAADPRIGSAAPDIALYASELPSDPDYALQAWHYDGANGINLQGVAGRSDGTRADGTRVVVAVVDTGITAHPDLPNVLPGYDFVSDPVVANDGGGRDPNAADPGDWCPPSRATSSWHGTHVAGTIGATADNGVGGLGVASGVSILPVRVLGRCGGRLGDVIAGIRWAAGLSVPGVPANPTPASVINLSIGGIGGCYPAMRNAIIDARNAGAVVVVSAGNDGWDAWMSTPANCAEALTVAATGGNGDAASYTNFGALVDLAAPGGQGGDIDTRVYSTLNAGATTPGEPSYGAYRGTSMAAPHVAGVAALVAAVRPGVTPDELDAILTSTARPFAAGTRCATIDCGTGILDAGAAIDAIGRVLAIDSISTVVSTGAIVDGPPISLPVSSLGLALAAESDARQVCSIADGAIRLHQRGTCQLSLWHSGNESTRAAVAYAPFMIAGLPVAISHEPIGAQALATRRVPLYATVSDAQSYTVSASGACSYTAGYFTLLTAGTCSFLITAMPDRRHAYASLRGSFAITATGEAAPPSEGIPTIAAPTISNLWMSSSTRGITITWHNSVGSGAVENRAACTATAGGGMFEATVAGTATTATVIVERGRSYTCTVTASAPGLNPGTSAPGVKTLAFPWMPAAPQVLSATATARGLELVLLDPWTLGSGPSASVTATGVGLTTTTATFDQETRLTTLLLSGYTGAPRVSLYSTGLEPIGRGRSAILSYTAPRLGAPLITSVRAAIDARATTLTATTTVVLPSVATGDQLRVMNGETPIPVRIGTVTSDAEGWVTIAPRSSTTTLVFPVPLSTPGETVLRIEARGTNGEIGSSSLTVSTPLAMSAPATPSGTTPSLSTVRIFWSLTATDLPYLRGWRSTWTTPAGAVTTRGYAASARVASFYVPSIPGTSLVTLTATGVIPESAPVRFSVVRTSSGTTITRLP